MQRVTSEDNDSIYKPKTTPKFNQPYTFRLHAQVVLRDPKNGGFPFAKSFLETAFSIHYRFIKI